VQSAGVYQFTLQNGEHLVGTFEKLPTEEAAGKDVEISSAARNIRVQASELVNLQSQKENFWHQLRGSISFGTSYTSGNRQIALNSASNVTYQARLWAAGASYTSSFSGQSTGSQTNLQEVQAAADRFLGQNSFVLALSNFLHSSQQQLNPRHAGRGIRTILDSDEHQSFAVDRGSRLHG
jgi:hypothetical protein